MEMTIAGKRFQLRPVLTYSKGYPQGRPLSEIYRWRDVFDWNCDTEKQTWRLRGAREGIIRTPILAVTYVAKKYRVDEDKAASARMKAQVFRYLGINSQANLVNRLNRYFGTHVFEVDYKVFDWLKPVASFVLRLETEFIWFEAATPDGRYVFYIAIPHKARLEADILGFCNREEFLAGLERGKSIEFDAVPLARGKPRSRVARAVALKQRRDELQMTSRPPGATDPRIDEIDKQLKELREGG